MVRNDDWTVLDLFEYLGALTGSRKRFFMLLQAAMHPLARRGSEQENLRDRLNTVLARDGWKLAISGYESHYPVYGVVPIGRGVQGKPKNLIFASNGPKPEIGFADAINNDIVILSHADSCLVYDRPISRAGLRWTELVEWWCAEQCPPGTTEDAARKLLGKRLRISLASDGERGLFDVYFRGLRPQLGDRLPALIPQVYLHYDPAVVSRLRHREPLPRQRMDFLLLLPNDGRVVIEVDGQQHFCEGDKPSLGRYSEMVRADRDLRLLGYEVYRFGANELVGPAAARNAVEFLEGLFRKHALEQPVRN